MSNRPTMREALKIAHDLSLDDRHVEARGVMIEALADAEAQMPELPDPTVHWPKDLPLVGGGAVKAGMYWTANQMRAYGQACADAARAAAPQSVGKVASGPVVSRDSSGRRWVDEPQSVEPIGEVVIGEEGMTKGWTVIRWRADLPPIAVGTKLYTAPPPHAHSRRMV